jgi:23S rRNA (cytidine1920-2'-O)/16S rRNA (cytidine1409-2'-O)-methyltransferase
MEGVNARTLSLPQRVDCAVIDVSFISLRMILPATAKTLNNGSTIVALFKPQFEAARNEVPRGGVIRDSELHETLLERFTSWCAANGFEVLAQTASPILGAEGNREFLFWLRPPEAVS